MFELGFDLPPPGSREIRQALYRQLKSAILDGRLAAGSQLPPSRKLAEALGVSRNSVVVVYDLLAAEGYLSSRIGAGAFVAPSLPVPGKPAAPPTARLARLSPEPSAPSGAASDFRLGSPDLSGFPFAVWQRMTSRVIRRFARGQGGYRDPAGSRRLREAIALHVSATRAVACDPDDILVTSGAQQAFDLLARVMVADGRRAVAVEEPGYPPVRAAFEAAGASLLPVPVDRHGMRVDLLAGAQAVYVTPSHQFPFGVSLSPERRRALLAYAQAHDAVVIEDDYDGEFRFAGRPLDALQTLDRQGRVFYVGTFSKSLFPELRIGFVVSPPWARDRLLRARQIADWHGPIMEQESLAEFIAEGHLVRHVRRMRKIYGERRSILIAALRRHCGEWLDPAPASAGLHIAAEFRRPIDGDALAGRAREAGILIETLERYALGEPRLAGLCFGYGRIAAEGIEPAVERLAASCRGWSAFPH